MQPLCRQSASSPGSGPVEGSWHSIHRNLFLPLDCKGCKKGAKQVSGDWMKVSLVGLGAARWDVSAVFQHRFALCMWEHLHPFSPGEISVPLFPEAASNSSSLLGRANVTLNTLNAKWWLELREEYFSLSKEALGTSKYSYSVLVLLRSSEKATRNPRGRLHHPGAVCAPLRPRPGEWTWPLCHRIAPRFMLTKAVCLQSPLTELLPFA